MRYLWAPPNCQKSDGWRANSKKCPLVLFFVNSPFYSPFPGIVRRAERFSQAVNMFRFGRSFPSSHVTKESIGIFIGPNDLFAVEVGVSYLILYQCLSGCFFCDVSKCAMHAKDSTSSLFRLK